MATGDQTDMAARIGATLPLGWFPDDAPVLNAILQGLGAGWAQLYAATQYAATQTRIATAEGMWLDLAAADYLGTAIARRNLETDANFRLRVQKEILRLRNTRQAVISVLTDLTGRAPLIFEPMQTGDTGGWDTTVLAYDTAGAFGDTSPFAMFVTAYRPAGVTIPNAGGYDQGLIGFDVTGEWTDASLIEAQVTDADIYAAADSVRAAGVTIWVRITD